MIILNDDKMSLDEALEHHGIKGQKWGKVKAKNPKTATAAELAGLFLLPRPVGRVLHRRKGITIATKVVELKRLYDKPAVTKAEKAAAAAKKKRREETLHKYRHVTFAAAVAVTAARPALRYLDRQDN